ncbi:MAG: hypothetical protein NT013_04875 [Planctomycetia bacterium]|nr:hypothetical protein [Planctomycetia bacterium]
MITQNAMLDVLVKASPEIAQDYSEFVADFSDERELPCYLYLGDYSQCLVELLESDADQLLSSAFEAIETLYQNGDDYVENATTVGILENLQNRNLHRSTSPDQFVKYLRPLSLKNWQEVNVYLKKVHGN